MIIAGLIFACLMLTAQTVYIVRTKKRVAENYHNWVEGVNDFFNQKPDGSPSHFNQVVDSIAVLFADRQRIAMMAAERGQQGAAVRDVNRGLEEIAAENNPAYAIASALPRSLKKNQAAQAGLMYLIQNIMNKNGGGPGRGPSGDQSEFNF